MNGLKKGFALLVSICLGAAILGGCGEATGSEAKVQETESAQSVKEYNGQDVSQPADLVMYVIGDEAAGEKAVLEELNKKLKEKINATLTVNHMSLSDYAQKYSLLISSGEKFDLIYTSTWAMYAEEATKGAFAEVSTDVLEKYMPLTKEQEPKEAFEQASIGGKTYFVPANNPTILTNAVVIRGDLREKYNLERLKTLDDLEEYYDKVIENEKGIFPYAASQNNYEMRIAMLNNNYNMVGLNGVDQFFYYKVNEKTNAKDIFWLYDTPEYKEWIKKMKSWSDKGFWSKNAVANNTNPRDAFTNGTSASLVWNLGTCGAVANQIEKEHPQWKPEIYDLIPDSKKILGAYTGDGAAVLASSENQERAFMLIDLLKFDEECNNLVRLGVKDIHWIDPTEEIGEEGFWRAGEKQEEYPFGSAFSWAFKNNKFEKSREDKFPDEVDLTKKWTAAQENTLLAGFILDDNNIKNELANLNNVKTKYVPLLDLGLVEDAEETLAEFNKQAEAAGINKVKEELLKQVDAYLTK